MRIQEVVNGTLGVQVAKQASQEIAAAKEVSVPQRHKHGGAQISPRTYTYHGLKLDGPLRTDHSLDGPVGTRHSTHVCSLRDLQAWSEHHLVNSSNLWYDIALDPNMRFLDTTMLGHGCEWDTKLQLGHNREKLKQQVADLEVAVGRMEGITAREVEKAAAAEAPMLETRSQLMRARREALKAAIDSVAAIGIPVL